MALDDGGNDDVRGEGLDLLETDWQDVPERQRSMRAVFDYSWNLLTERERDVFQALSVFRGGFTREAARQITGASLRELMALSDVERTDMGERGRQLVRERFAWDVVTPKYVEMYEDAVKRQN